MTFAEFKKFMGRAARGRSKSGPAAAVLSMLMLASCAMVGPDYVPPETSAPDAWHTDLGDGLRAAPVDLPALSRWWTILEDPVLSELVEQAAGGSLDLRQAKARVREARARRGMSRASLFPTLDSSGSASRSRSSENTGGGGTRDLYAAGFDAGWELDIFGGVRRSVEAASADLEATQEDLRDVLVTLLAEVGVNYLEARTYQARLSVAQANLETQQETFSLIRSRYEAGLSDELAVNQARYNLEDTRSQIPTLRSGLEGALNRLAVLTGRTPGSVHALLAESKPIPVTPPAVAVGVPAETLRRRPDIRKAERELAAQTARIGEAVAELYPKFSLAGSIGLESLSSGDFLHSASRSWSIGPGISWRIFDAGSVRGNIEVQSALQEQYLVAYEAALLGALEEVENALTSYAEEQVRRDCLAAAADAAQNAVDISQEKYRAGLVDFSDVLDSQRSLLSFQDQIAQSRGTVTSNLIRLYKVLGGGWNSLSSERKTP